MGTNGIGNTMNLAAVPYLRRCLALCFACCLALLAARPAWAAGAVGSGLPGSCDDNKFATALNNGGLVTFNCGNNPFTMPANTHVIQHNTTVLGANKITLDGENLRQLFIVDSNVTLTLVNIVLLDGNFSTGGCIDVDVHGSLVTDHVTFEGCHDISGGFGGGAVRNRGTFLAGNSTFKNNNADHEGGAVLNTGNFTALQVVFQSNQAVNGGGAIMNSNDGVAVIEDSLFTGNTAQNSGGAIQNILFFPKTTGSLTVRRSLFTGNKAVAHFGGAINNSIGRATIENCSFESNTADDGGAIFADGMSQITVEFSTFNDNRADIASGIHNFAGGSVTLGYSIITNGRNTANTASSLNCDGPALISLGYNIISDGTCVDSSNSHDHANTLPKLGPLKDNGGFTKTQLPNNGSPALSQVPPGLCLPRDQRDALRVGTCDIGAAEVGGLFNSAFLPQVHNN